MLVKLYELPILDNHILKSLSDKGYIFRNALAPEKHIVTKWVKENFSEQWASEVDVAMSKTPSTCIIVQNGDDIKGFACYETTGKSFFGPTAVLDTERGNGLGKALLIKALEGLKNMGYAYGIIGGVGPADFYTKAVGATAIENSTPGIYKNILH